MESRHIRQDLFELQQRWRTARDPAVRSEVLARVSRRLLTGCYLTPAAAAKTAESMLRTGDGWLAFD